MENKQQSLVFGIICIVVVSVLIYKYCPSSDTLIHDPENEFKAEEHLSIVVAAEEIKPPKPKIRPKYPHCLRNDTGELIELLIDLVENITTCDLSEAASASCDGRGAAEGGRGGVVVIYTAVALLLVSLCAAAVELWRARTRGSSPVAAGNSVRDHPQLSRRCSLADLTVLRHNRRESMLRRDGSIDSPQQQRVSLKLLGSSKSQDESRRSSVSKACKWQRSVSADKADENVPDHFHHRIHMIRHH